MNFAPLGLLRPQWITLGQYSNVHVRPRLAAQLDRVLRLEDEPHYARRQFTLKQIAFEWFEEICSELSLPLDIVPSVHLRRRLTNAFPLLDNQLGPPWRERRVYYAHIPRPENCPEDGCRHEKNLEVTSASVEMRPHQLTVTVVVKQFGFMGEMETKEQN